MLSSIYIDPLNLIIQIRDLQKKAWMIFFQNYEVKKTISEKTLNQIADLDPKFVGAKILNNKDLVEKYSNLNKLNPQKICDEYHFELEKLLNDDNEIIINYDFLNKLSEIENDNINCYLINNTKIINVILEKIDLLDNYPNLKFCFDFDKTYSKLQNFQKVIKYNSVDDLIKLIQDNNDGLLDTSIIITSSLTLLKTANEINVHTVFYENDLDIHQMNVDDENLKFWLKIKASEPLNINNIVYEFLTDIEE